MRFQHRSAKEIHQLRCVNLFGFQAGESTLFFSFRIDFFVSLEHEVYLLYLAPGWKHIVRALKTLNPLLNKLHVTLTLPKDHRFVTKLISLISPQFLFRTRWREFNEFLLHIPSYWIISWISWIHLKVWNVNFSLWSRCHADLTGPCLVNCES